MNDFIRGKDFNLYFSINGQYYPAGRATDGQIKLTAEVQETTTKNTLRGKTFDYTNKYSYILSLSGFTNLVDESNFSLFQDAIMQSNKLLYVFTDSYSIEWSGTVLVTDIGIDSPFASISSNTVNFQGDGELVKVTTNVPPTPGNPSVYITDQFGDVLAIVPAPGTYSVLQFDTIDCGTAANRTPGLVIIPAT